MNKTIVAIAIAGSLAVSLSAFANKGADYEPNHKKQRNNMDWSKGWYVGVGINGNAEGTMNLHGSPEVFEHYLDDSFDEVELTSNNIGFDAYIGRRINKYWSAELGYTWLGNIDFDAEIDEVTIETIEVKQWNVHLVGIGKLPVGQYVNFFAKAGAAYFNSTQEFKAVFTDVHDTDTVHTMALTYGAGAEVTWDHWGVRGEYNVIWPDSSVRDDFYIADIISANIYYRFN